MHNPLSLGAKLEGHSIELCVGCVMYNCESIRHFGCNEPYWWGKVIWMSQPRVAGVCVLLAGPLLCHRTAQAGLEFLEQYI